MFEVDYILEKKSKDGLLEELKQLQQSSSDIILFKNDKKEKKKKKNKIFDELNDLLSNDSETTTKSTSKKEVDLDEIVQNMDEEYDGLDEDAGINSFIINREKKGYNKLKKQENDFKKEFAEELTLLYTLLSESNTFGKKLEKKYESMDGSKTRNSSKYITDIINSIIMNKNSKLSILREIASIKKSIVDLKIKDTRVKDENFNSVDHLASTYLKNILNYGRNNFVKNFTDHDEFEEYNPNLNDNELNEYEHKRFDRLIDERLTNSEDNYRTEEGNKFIAYEKMGAKIMVQRNIDTGDWDFIAVDKNKQLIDDYPLPTKESITKMKFADDGLTATDQYGRTYKVKESYEFTE
jgi:hypothetical protein